MEDNQRMKAGRSITTMTRRINIAPRPIAFERMIGEEKGE
jgi:hypothetical protein